MSGGQRSRLAMAAVSFMRPHVLILDEPTNNLGPDPPPTNHTNNPANPAIIPCNTLRNPANPANLTRTRATAWHLNAVICMCVLGLWFVVFWASLDTESVEALAHSVRNFEGGVVMVSHDQHFVSQVANEVWVIDNGTVTKCPSFEHYIKEAEKAARATKTIIPKSPSMVFDVPRRSAPKLSL